MTPVCKNPVGNQRLALVYESGGRRFAPGSVREIDWADRLIHLDVNRQKVKGSPSYDPSITIDGAYEEKFLTYYGIRWVAP